MGFKLEKKKTGATPYVMIDEDNNYMKFEGKSFSENASEFFDEVITWLEGYLTTDFKAFTFDCDLRYFNSSTAKLLYNMLLDMDDASSGKKNVTVNWITDKDNAVTIEFAEDFREELDNLEFNLILR